MPITIDRVREELRDISGALASSDPSEPNWLVEADIEWIAPFERLFVLERVGGDTTGGLVSAERVRRLRDQVGGEVNVRGIEALAWYRSFRFTAKPWGIFIRAAGIDLLQRVAFARLRAPIPTKCDVACQSLWLHEAAHFAIDASIAQFELATRRALWMPRKDGFWRRGTYDPVEEKVANASMLRGAHALSGPLRIVGRVAALRDWTRTQPSGYATGYRFTSDREFPGLVNRLGAQFLRPAIRLARTRSLITLTPLVESAQNEAARVVPVYLVLEPGSSRSRDLGLFPAIRIVKESANFVKQLRHVDPAIQQAYSELKGRLRNAPPRGADRFKKWPPLGRGTWSLRLNRGYRLHVRHVEGIDFEAIEVGSHTAVGHG